MQDRCACRLRQPLWHALLEVSRTSSGLSESERPKDRDAQKRTNSTAPKSSRRAILEAASFIFPESPDRPGQKLRWASVVSLAKP